MVHEPFLYVWVVIMALYAAFCLTFWAFDIKHTRRWIVLFISLSSGAFAAFFLIFGVRW